MRIAGALTLAFLANAGEPQATAGEPQATWDRFPAFVWRLDHTGRPLPAELVAGFGGTDVEGDEPAAWVQERGLDFYVGRVAGWSELHLERTFPWYDALWKRWYEERDPTLLVRQPCLSDPSTRERLSGHMEATLEARERAHGLFLLLGDEVGLTPSGDPIDLCTCARCQEAWSAFAAEERARRGLEPSERPPPMPDTDHVRRAWAAGDASGLGPWLARRRFHQDAVVRLLADLASEARRRAPGTPLGLAGLTGATAFGGVAFERLLSELDVVETYPVGYARELFATLRTDQRSLATVFVGSASAEPESAERASAEQDPVLVPSIAADAAAWQAWEHWLRGGDGIVVWSDRELARSKAARERLVQALADIRSVRERTPGFRPRPSGVALVHSADSIALAWLKDALIDGPTWPRRFAGYQEEHGTRERSVRTWLRLAEDAGYLPGALPIDDVGARTRERFPLLVLCHELVLDAAARAKLAEHVAAGGALLVDGPLGLFDRYGSPPESDAFAALAALAPERVRRAPEGLADYLRVRTAAESAGARELRTMLVETVARAGGRPPPCPLEPASSGVPWLVAANPGPREGEWTCAAIPNLLDGRERARLLATSVIEVPGDGSLRWIHPERGERERSRELPAGDAAMFVVGPP